MWYPVSIETKNLFSHQHTLYKFRRGKLTLVFGRNEDRKKRKSNGAGKSGLFESVTLALTGEVYRGIPKGDFIMNGEKECQSILKLRNDVLNLDLRIDRKLFKSSKSAELVLSSNNKALDERCKKLTSVPESNKFIFELIGISREDFMNYFLIGQGNNHSFFTATDSNQKDIINRFSNVQLLDNLIKAEEEELEKLEAEHNELNIQRHKAEAVKESVEAEIEELEAEETDEEDPERVKIQKKVAVLVSSNAKTEEENTMLTKRVKTIKKELATLTSKEDSEELLGDCDYNIDTLNKGVEDIDDKIDALNKELRRLKNLSGEDIECPKCGEKFIPNSDLSPEEVESGIKNISEDIELKKKEREPLIESRKELKSSRVMISDNIDLVDELNRKSKRAAKTIEDNNTTIQANIKTIEKLNKALEDWAVEDKTAAKLAELRSKLKIQSKALNLVNKSLRESYENISRRKEVLKHLSKSGFKTYLANKSIKTIQDITNFQLNRFDYNLQVQINGFKVLASGELRDKIDIVVFDNGINGGTFKKYSGGEKSAIDISGMLSVRDMINNTAEYGKGFDGMFLDEKIASLDDSGQVEAIKILSKTGITAMVVMHHINDVELNDVNRVTLVKRNKITTIEE